MVGISNSLSVILKGGISFRHMSGLENSFQSESL